MKSLFYLLSISLLLSAGACKNRGGATNEYRNAKTHPSESIAKEHKKAAKKARKDFKKTMKKNKKKLNT